MRTIHKLRDIEISLFRLRVSRGHYLKDVSYKNLSENERIALLGEAKLIQFGTHMDLRLVRRKGKFVWRFLDRN